HDRLFAAQWRKICNETTCLHEAVNIDIYRIAECSLRVAERHLPRTNENRIAKMSRAIQSRGAFQHQEFIDAGIILDHDGGARYLCRDAASVNCRPICFLWSLNKHCPLLKIQTARPTIEIKCSMGGETHNRFVRKTQLSARSVAGPHNSLLMDDVVYRGPARSVLRIR